MLTETNSFVNKFNIHVSSLMISSLCAIVFCQNYFRITVKSSKILLFASLLVMRHCTLWEIKKIFKPQKQISCHIQERCMETSRRHGMIAGEPTSYAGQGTTSHSSPSGRQKSPACLGEPSYAVLATASGRIFYCT